MKLKIELDDSPTAKAMVAEHLLPAIKKAYFEHRIAIAYCLLYLLAWLITGQFYELRPISVGQYTYVIQAIVVAAIAWFYLCCDLVRLRVSGAQDRVPGEAEYWRRIRREYLCVERLIGLACVFVIMPLFLSVFGSMKGAISLIQPFAWDDALSRIDRAIHFGIDPWRIFSPLLRYPEAVRFIDFVYVLWYIVAVTMTLWQAWSSNRTVRAQFLITWILVWILLGNVLATLLSSAGPCYYSLVTGNEDVFKALFMRLQDIHQSRPLYALRLQEQLWQSYTAVGGARQSLISAMPSLHVAMAALFVMVARAVNKWAYRAALVFLVLILCGSVALGWHYAIDGYISIILVIVLWHGAGRMLQLKALRAKIEGQERLEGGLS
jgi:hypothetical protein